MSMAIVFPGQGSQSIGMGKELYDNFPAARAVFEEVDDALGFSLTRLMQSGDAETLTQTENAQPAIMSVSLAAVKALEAESGIQLKEMALCVAGHSLGEYSALCAAGSLSIADTAKLLRTRGLAMKEAGKAVSGTMAALLGLDLKQVSKIVIEVSDPNDFCVIANDNCYGQTVISGHEKAVRRAMEAAMQAGAKKALELQVSGAFHCPLMQSAADKMQEVLENTTLRTPSVPVVANITAEFEQNPERIKELLVAQVTGSVRWTESVEYMTSKGVTDFIECGNGKVLCGLIRRINATARSISVGNKEGVLQGLTYIA